MKPCPFCGSKPTVASHFNDTGGGDGHRCYVVKCNNKGCIRPSSVACGPHGYPRPESDDHPTNEAAESAAKYQWNIRSTASDSDVMAALKAVMAAYTEKGWQSWKQDYNEKVAAWKLATDAIENAKGHTTNPTSNPA